jgi:2-keto-3-deoxy-6-phosphogluconate aldolase
LSTTGKLLKYFHAEKNGGVKSLKFLDDIFNDIKFIPTGGINMEILQIVI